MKLNKEQIVKDLKTLSYTSLWIAVIIGLIAGLTFKPDIFLPVLIFIMIAPLLLVVFVILKDRYIIDE